MEFLRRSLSYGLRLRVCKHPVQVAALRNANYSIQQPITPIARYLIQTRFISATNPEPANIEGLRNSEARDNVDKSAKNQPITLRQFDRALARFEERAQRAERVHERDFVKIFDYMTKTVASLEQSGKFDQDAKVSIAVSATALLRCCGKLMSESHEKVRELLAGNLWQFLKEKQIPLDISLYNSLVRVLNENNTNFDPQKILDEIKEANATPDRITYQRLIHQYCLQGDIGGATKLLEDMKSLQFELNESIFASLLLGYSKQDNPPTIKEMFDLMNSNNVEPGARSVASALLVIGKSSKEKPQMLEELKFLQQIILKEEIQFNIYELADIYSHLGPLRDHLAVKELLDLITNSLGNGMVARNRIINSLLLSNQTKYASEIYWSVTPSRVSIETGNVGSVYIKNLAKYKHISTDFAIEECSKLRDQGYNQKPFHMYYYSAAESGNLIGVRASLKKIAEDEPIKCQYYWPLIAQAKDNNEILQVLKNDLDPKINSHDLIDTFSQWVWPKFAGEYKKVFEANKELGYDRNMLVASFLYYLVQENRLTDATQFLAESELTDSAAVGEETNNQNEDDNEVFDGETSLNRKLPRSNDRSAMIGKMLDQIAEQTKDPELVNKAYNMCILSGQPVTKRTVGPLVKVHLLNDDFDKALEVFLKIAEDHKIAACVKLLMNRCLTKKDPENLQTIMNILSDLYGEANSLYDLATCCIQLGKFKQAQKIFASPGFRVRPTRVYQTARLLSKYNDLTLLESFVHMSRGMYDINQEYLYQVLVDAYERTSNARKALELWNTMQEEEFQPSKRCMIMIARVLEKNNIKVPFQKPKLNLRETNAISNEP